MTLVVVAAIAALGASLLSGCKESAPADPKPVRASPNATIVPQPLLTGTGWVAPKTPKAGKAAALASASATTTSARDRLPAPPAIPFSLETLPTDAAKPQKVREPLVLTGEFTWPEIPSRGPLYGLRGELLAAAQAESRRTLSIDLRAQDRMVIKLDTSAFPLLANTTIAARAEYLGFVLGFPDSPRRRLLPQGVMRALFVEGRADASPLLSAIVKSTGAGRVLGMATEVSKLSSEYGLVTLEQALFTGLGEGGVLLCRFLLEFAGVAPTSAVCEEDRVPLLADYELDDGGRLRFQVLRVDTKPEGAGPLPRVPPRNVSWEDSGVPQGKRRILRPAVLSALRPGSEDGPRDSLRIYNHDTRAAYVVLNHVPAAVVEPLGKTLLRGLRRGNYEVQYVDFLGRRLGDTEVVAVPINVHVGNPLVDAGAPPPARKP